MQMESIWKVRGSQSTLAELLIIPNITELRNNFKLAKEFIGKLSQLDSDADKEEAINILCEEVYSRLMEKKLDLCDSYIVEFIKYDFSIKLHVAFLTVTKPFKNKLENRLNLFNKLKDMIYSQRPKRVADNIISTVE